MVSERFQNHLRDGEYVRLGHYEFHPSRMSTVNSLVSRALIVRAVYTEFGCRLTELGLKVAHYLMARRGLLLEGCEIQGVDAMPDSGKKCRDRICRGCQRKMVWREDLDKHLCYNPKCEKASELVKPDPSVKPITV